MIVTKRGRRMVAVTAFLLLAIQLGSGLHATGHALADGGPSCQACLVTDQPIAMPSPPQPGCTTHGFHSPVPGGIATPLPSVAFLLPPCRGPPVHS